MLRCLECGCSRFDVRGVGCALCGKAHGPRWERCYITDETQRTLLAHADALQQFGVTLTEERPLQKDAGTTLGIIALVLAAAESLDDGVLRKLLRYLHELGISRNEILRLRLSEPEEVDTILHSFLQPPPEEAFDTWFRILSFRGRHALTGLQPMLRQQLQNLQKSFNEAFAAERNFPEHAPTLPMYLDYIDADDDNAIATNDGQHYAFVGVTLPLVFKISDVSVVLSKSPSITTALQLRVSNEPYNDLQGTLFYILVSFVVGHEWSHHKHGHLQQLSTPKAIFQEVAYSGRAGSIETQLQELGADGYSAFSFCPTYSTTETLFYLGSVSTQPRRPFCSIKCFSLFP